MGDLDWARIRRRLNQDVTERGEWAGAPMPISNLPLVLEKRYPYQGLQGMTLETIGKRVPHALEEPGVTIRNSWFSNRHHARVYVFEVDGRVRKFVEPQYGGKALDLWVNTMMAAQAWSVEAELRALSKLKELIKPHLYEGYFLSGSFLETSKRTGLIYVFRKLRPTIALRADKDGNLRILSVLCLHPLGYYHRSFGGVMTPTDDVIAHLLLMRGDEAYYWRKANHHASWEPEAGL